MQTCEACYTVFGVLRPANVRVTRILGGYRYLCNEHTSEKVQDGTIKESAIKDLDYLDYTCPECGYTVSERDAQDIDADNPPAWALGADPYRCELCGALLTGTVKAGTVYTH